MLLFGVFIAIFVGVGLVYKEIERRTLYAILAKPIGRGQFLLGKYLGLCLTLLVNVIIMGVGVSLGLVFGSFLNVVIYRLPRGENIAFPASHCTSCGKPIRVS